MGLRGLDAARIVVSGRITGWRVGGPAGRWPGPARRAAARFGAARHRDGGQRKVDPASSHAAQCAWAQAYVHGVRTARLGQDLSRGDAASNVWTRGWVTRVS
jgi:hypothetical protein